MEGADRDNTKAPEADLAQALRERDLYRRLIELGTHEEIKPFLDQALSLIIAITSARRGYIELQSDSAKPGAPGSAPEFWMARGCSEIDVAEIREVFSSGVIAKAIATGKTIETSSALSDPRFRDRLSVRRNRIEAVLCSPIGSSPPLGVLYLQDREQPGPFSEEDRSLAEMFSRYLAVFADRLLVRRRDRDDSDPTRIVRARLQANGVVGRSKALAQLLDEVASLAVPDVTVLLTGPSGTGKTQIARVIHENSKRAKEPFLVQNCAALPEGLFENELFGAVKGGHSGGPVEGKIAAAGKGTLFLDEVAELSLGAQAKLLTFLDSKEYYPLGSSAPLQADVRIVAATNSDLDVAVKQRRFREDLYFRLMHKIRVPSLAERREDIPELAKHFCAHACKTHGFAQLELSEVALLAAEFTEWPGNIRQLMSVVERAAIRAASEGVLQIERRHLFPELVAGDESRHPTFQQETRRFQEKLVRAVLLETNWNITETHTRLEISRAHLYNLIKAFGLERPKSG